MSNPSDDSRADDTIVLVALLLFQASLNLANYPDYLKRYLHKRVELMIKRRSRPEPEQRDPWGGFNMSGWSEP